MKHSKLLFVGIKGSVIALDRATGEKVWSARLKGNDFVNVIVNNGRILAACYGEIYCLDPLSGQTLWHNPLKGYGTGLAAMATDDNPGSGVTAIAMEKALQDQQAAAAASTAAMTASTAAAE